VSQKKKGDDSQFHPQLLIVEIAFAFVRIALGFISAGNNHGSSNHVLLAVDFLSGVAFRRGPWLTIQRR